ncbi:MAG: DUF2148 domain-containing protein [Methanomicrobiales archaeon]|jgi:uncharacterized ferredoxin-like protein
MTTETDAVKSVAGLMALAARTAPKAVGIDSISIEVVTGKDLKLLGDEMIRMAEESGVEFFGINGRQVKESDACVLIGVAGRQGLGADCSGCGYATCVEMAEALKKTRKKGTAYAGPNCVLKVSDLGIAVGSAVKTASIHNVDNRIMYSAGVVALKLGRLKGCSVAYGIPLKASGKNIFFDIQFKH